MKKHLLIGNGKMGSAFINKISNKFDMTVVSPNSKPQFKSNYYRSLQEMEQDVSEPFDIITFGLKPNKMGSILEQLNSRYYTGDTSFISLAAGARTSLFHEKLGKDKKVSLVMTNIPVEIGKGVLGVYPQDLKFDFLEELGHTIYLKSEDDIDRFCSLVACGSGFCYKILNMYKENAELLNFQTQIDMQNLIIELFQGSLELVRNSKGSTFEDKIDQVVNPGGPTDIGVKYLGQSNQHFQDCLLKAKERTTQIGKEVNPKQLYLNNKNFY